eukprot:GHVU01060125.1.p2 GENE.GHVU01060125.1~~GHVU01060125.1.p2  ORF type:complete len:105 (-),score=2.11 GHVU01060125.1:195-509(-)
MYLIGLCLPLSICPPFVPITRTVAAGLASSQAAVVAVAAVLVAALGSHLARTWLASSRTNGTERNGTDTTQHNTTQLRLRLSVCRSCVRTDGRGSGCADPRATT